MSAKGVIFQAHSVRAILEGRKTQTRRVVKLNPAYVERYRDNPALVSHFCPYKPGSLLYVKETWREVMAAEGDGRAILFRADEDRPGPWRSPLFLKREDARLTLRVESVRVERLQEISEAECVAEGVNDSPGVRHDFAKGWDFINGKRAPWSSNPWVWVVEFSKVTP